jgi:hypothetical protein
MQYLADLMAKAEEINARGDSGGEGTSDFPALRFYNLKVDENRIGDYVFSFFLMPYESATGENKLFQEHWKHYRMPVGMADGRPELASRTCIEKQGGVTCPFCEVLRSELASTNNSERRKTISRLMPVNTAYVNALPLTAFGRPVDFSVNGGADGKTPYLPHILGLKSRLYEDVVRYLVNQNNLAQNPDLDPFNPHNALPYEVTVSRTGKRKQDIRYRGNFGLTRGKFAATDDMLEGLYQHVYDLTAIFKMPKDEDLSTYPEDARNVAAMMAETRKSVSGLFSGVPAQSVTPPAAYAAPAYAPAPVPVAPTTVTPAFTPVPSAPAVSPSAIPSRYRGVAAAPVVNTTEVSDDDERMPF